jgi:hypothetical protein
MSYQNKSEMTKNNYEQHKSFTNRTADWTYQRKYKNSKSYEALFKCVLWSGFEKLQKVP